MSFPIFNIGARLNAFSFDTSALRWENVTAQKPVEMQTMMLRKMEMQPLEHIVPTEVNDTYIVAFG